MLLLEGSKLARAIGEVSPAFFMLISPSFKIDYRRVSAFEMLSPFNPIKRIEKLSLCSLYQEIMTLHSATFVGLERLARKQPDHPAGQVWSAFLDRISCAGRPSDTFPFLSRAPCCFLAL
jgi:hypothetical protein